MLINHDETPYRMATPLVRLSSLARVLNNLQKKGWKIGIISWLAKGSTKEYDERVTKAKKEWLGIHLKSVKFDNIDIVSYGTPKEIGRHGILFDDEIQNRENWKGTAYNEKNIMEILKKL